MFQISGKEKIKGGGLCHQGPHTKEIRNSRKLNQFMPRKHFRLDSVKELRHWWSVLLKESPPPPPYFLTKYFCTSGHFTVKQREVAG